MSFLTLFMNTISFLVFLLSSVSSITMCVISVLYTSERKILKERLNGKENFDVIEFDYSSGSVFPFMPYSANWSIIITVLLCTLELVLFSGDAGFSFLIASIGGISCLCSIAMFPLCLKQAKFQKLCSEYLIFQTAYDTVSTINYKPKATDIKCLTKRLLIAAEEAFMTDETNSLYNGSELNETVFKNWLSEQNISDYDVPNV